MNEADRKIRELAEWLKTSIDQPSNESWTQLFQLSGEHRKAQARKNRNKRYYQKTVLKRLNDRLKASEMSEIVLNGVSKRWVKQGSEIWRLVNDDRRAKGGMSLPVDKDGGWYVETAILERLGVRIGE